jgi:hypothetical protein
MSGFRARTAALSVVHKRHRCQATAAARCSIGGSPKRRVTRDDQHPENRSGLRACHRLVSRLSLRRPDKRGNFGAQRNEAVRHEGASRSPPQCLCSAKLFVWRRAHNEDDLASVVVRGVHTGAVVPRATLPVRAVKSPHRQPSPPRCRSFLGAQEPCAPVQRGRAGKKEDRNRRSRFGNGDDSDSTDR